MRILIACEFSGVVREAFGLAGHDMMSCDLLPTEKEGGNISPHWQGDIFECIASEPPFDMMIAFPPCTHLAVSGARWFKHKLQKQAAAIEFVKRLASMDIPRIAIENPVGVLSSRWRKPDQIIQPWWFGHGETKATCLWLKNLPKLRPTNIVEGREQRVWKMPPGPNRWRERSRTFSGVAEAMASQWSNL